MITARREIGRSKPRRLAFLPQQSRKLLLKRWHTLSGVGPLAAFVFAHLVLQAASLRGGASYASVATLTGSVAWGLLSGLFVLVPLAFHCGYGFWLTFEGSSSAGVVGSQDRASKLFLRASGLVALVFLVCHWIHIRLPIMAGELKPDEVYSELCASLSSTTAQGWPMVALGYLVGLAATMMHLSYGLTAFLRTFEIADDPARLRKVALGEKFTHGLCSLGFALGAAVLIELATGSWFFGVW